MRLWLLRHAAVLAPPGLCYGASDLPADPALTAQAAQAAAAQLPVGLPVWVSGLQRARQLAEALAALRPDLGPARTDPRLNEMDFGRWEGVPWADVPRQAFDAWLADFAHHRFGGVDSTQAVLDRVAQALAALCAEVGPGGEALWVTHAGVIRAASYLAGGGARPIAHVAHWPTQAPPPGGCTVVHLEAGWPSGPAGATVAK